MAELPSGAKDLLNRPLLAWATTVRSDGSLHSTVVWVTLDGDDVLVNTAVGRAKERHLREDARISISVLDPDDAFHWVTVAGQAKLETEGAEKLIDTLTKKYLDLDEYPNRVEGEVRITVRVTPDHVLYNTGG